MEYHIIPVNKQDGYLICDKENAGIIRSYFLEELGYKTFLDTDNPETFAYLIHKYGLNENCVLDAVLTTKERKAAPISGWKLIDLCVYRLNQEFKTRMSEKDRIYFSKEVRMLIEKGLLLEGLKNGDYHMLYSLANSGTAFSIKFASLFCRMLCKFHPDIGDGFADHFVVAEYKRLAKFSRDPQIDLSCNSYMLYCNYLKNFIGMKNGTLPQEQRLTMSEEWLLDIYMENK